MILKDNKFIILIHLTHSDNIHAYDNRKINIILEKKRGKLNFTHQKVSKVSFGGFPLYCIPTALGEKWRMGIKEREDEEGMEKGDGVREKNEIKGDGGRRKK